MAEAAANARASGKGPAPPNFTVVGGAYTENGTWGAGVGHFHTWDGDRYRYLDGIAKVNANLDYFGLLNGSAPWHAGRTFAGMVRPVRAVQLWRPHGVPVGPGSVAAAGAQ